MSKIIYLTKEKVTIVDEEDYVILSQYKWLNKNNKRS